MENYLERMVKSNYPEIKFNTDAPIENIINYFSAFNILKHNSEKEGKFPDRLQYDCDAFFYKNYAIKNDGEKYSDEDALCGDVMFSFWQPYKAALKLKTGYDYHKTTTYNGQDCWKPDWSLCKLQKDTKKIGSSITEVNSAFFDFAKICYTRGNFICLPSDGMNCQRGISPLEDRMDEALYECFAGGTLSKYFSNDNEKLKSWILNEKLSVFFSLERIQKKYILPLIGEFKSFSKMTFEEICEYVNAAVYIIGKRA